jgi:hypothetical protein
LQFSWYQFECFPREVVGRTYGNLRHVDIRQNGECMNSRLFSFVHILRSAHFQFISIIEVH